ncbi:PepSY domain-containing protein [Corynebacterium halotolerans]|uniref:PepSY domain-containing protein n=1 Tax=Corynebacterium halotolerans YIM 70093 = DSM 44683 TaxID=1121362 RepID=M1NT65_9CORY|nr:PepSY domain-containing protein [Corynebacterium halotolerans]AGF72667.1 hypothetical protein A605_08325 [Corynebacterium halotolerans YIM 70093 = DSM 44683]
MASRTIITAGIAVSAGLFLSACGDTGDTATPDNGADTTMATTTAPAESPTESPATTTEDNQGNQQTGEDPVFGAIGAVLNEHSDGIIVTVDREDDRDTYDIDVVTGNEVIELEVGADGTVREDERESGDEVVAHAQEATVTATDAIRQALDQHPDGVLDDAELEEEDGNLRWEISLDDADRNDLTELTVPAT